MATEKSMQNLHLWQKGTSGNLRGRPRKPRIDPELKALAQEELINAILKQLLMTPEQQKALAAAKSTTVAQKLVAELMKKAIKLGCVYRTQFIFSYVLGKPKSYENLEGNGDDDGNPEDPGGIPLTAVPTSALVELLSKYKPAAG